MPRRPPTTDRQRGQAIVVLAIVAVVLAAIVGLAIDGGRAYLDRRQMQSAVDAAALAAADDYSFGSHDPGRALDAGGALFARNRNLEAPAPGTGGTFSWPDYDLRVTASRRVDGLLFQASATHHLGLALITVLGTGPTVPIAAEAIAMAQPSAAMFGVLATRSTCPNGSSGSIDFNGNTSIIIGSPDNPTSVYSNGGITANNNADPVVNGDLFWHCGAAPPNINGGYGDHPGSGILPTPSVSLDQPAGPPRVPSRYQVVLQPGTYSAAFSPTGCEFLAPGIYDWEGGYSSQGGLVSNELRPPAESQPGGPITARAARQFWSMNVSCAGDIALEEWPAGTGTATSIQVAVTSVRTDGGVLRESPPSVCQTISLHQGSDAYIAISNVPGADAYRIYYDPGACATDAAFQHYVTVSAYPANQGNKATASCPYTPAAGSQWSPGWKADSRCDLGFVVAHVKASGLVEPAVAAWSLGSPPPRPSAAIPNGLGVPATPVSPGDRANEHFCTGTGCPSKPGAVAFRLTGTACLDQRGTGATYIFSGPQYENLVVYQPGAGCTQGDTLNGSAYTEYMGTIFAPQVQFTMTGGLLAPISGALIVYTLTASGGSSISLDYDSEWLPGPSASRLVH